MGGHRAATPSERAAIESSAGGSHPGYTISQIWIADSDSSWAALRYVPQDPSQQQGFGEVRHNSGGTWQSVSEGSAQVACSPSIPGNVRADFADLPGFGDC